MKIQLLKRNHIEGLLELYRQLLPNEHIEITYDMQNLLNKIDHDKNYNILIGTIGEKVVTTCTVIVIPNITHQMRPYAIIENVITHSKFRNKGYGIRILQAAQNIAKENNCYKIMIQTRRRDLSVLNFYQKAGFSKTITTGFTMDL